MFSYQHERKFKTHYLFVYVLYRHANRLESLNYLKDVAIKRLNGCMPGYMLHSKVLKSNHVYFKLLIKFIDYDNSNLSAKTLV